MTEALEGRPSELANCCDHSAQVMGNRGGIVLTLRWRAACVWDVAFTASGDLASGCADYVARLWTPDAARAAPAGAQQVSPVLNVGTCEHKRDLRFQCVWVGSGTGWRCAADGDLSCKPCSTWCQCLRQAAASATTKCDSGGGVVAGTLPHKPRLVDV